MWPFKKSVTSWVASIYEKTRTIDTMPISHDQALCNLARFKDEIDIIKWNYHVRDRKEVGYRNQLPENFLWAFLPFFSTVGLHKSSCATVIDPNKAIGYDSIACSNEGKPYNAERIENPELFLERLNFNTCNDEALPCRGYEIKELKIIYLCEGLSRPQLSKEVDMPLYCRLGTAPYPSARNLTLCNYDNMYFELKNDTTSTSELVILPRYIVPIMRAIKIKEVHCSVDQLGKNTKISVEIKSKIERFILQAN